MAVRTITITDDAYRRLKGLKQKGESFSDVIRRLARSRSALDFVGALSPQSGEALESSIRSTRGRIEAEMAERWKDVDR